MKLLDTSVILRFLTRDDPRKAGRVKRLIFESDEEIVVSDFVFLETVYALERTYGLSRDEIFAQLSKMLSFRRIDIINRDILQQALVLYKEHTVPFVDAYQVVLGREMGAEAIYTYDPHFEKKLKFPGIEP